jgi:hypothetical protein
MAEDRKSPAAALFLSVVPGAGHMYAGKTGEGVAWLVAVFIAYRMNGFLGFFLHVICAVKAAQGAQASNLKDREDLASRQETASQVAALLDDAVARRGPGEAPADPGPVGPDPPPRVMRAAFPVPPDRLVQVLADAMASNGLLVLGVDRAHHRVRGSVDHGGGRHTIVAAQVEGTPAGSRVRLLMDRPPGSPEDPAIDDESLRAILERAEMLLGGPPGSSPGAPAVSAVRGMGEALTEDHFLEQLREAWESYEQGWLPEAEWTERKASLVRSVTLRPGTRKSDFMTACRPLVEAGVLDVADLRSLEATIPS